MNKLVKIFLSLFFTFIVVYNFSNIRSILREHLPYSVKVKIKEVFFGKEYLDEIDYYKKLGYNVKIFPETQFEKLESKKFLLDKLDVVNKTHYGHVIGLQQNVKTFFIENFDTGLVITSAKGKIFFLNGNSLEKGKIILSNLNKFNLKNVLDITRVKDELYISIVFPDQTENNCSKIKILRSNFNKENLIFSEFFQIDECTEGTNALGGRIVQYKFNNKDGILFTTAASGAEKDLAQDDNSLFGKILFISLDGENKIIFSKGHRNPQGLLVFKNNILSTEHGAYGGDEINKILFRGNYGHPVASYGDTYSFKNLQERSNFKFKKNHSKYNFNEPIFSFVPSIGISEIIKVPKDFSKYWQNNFLVTSLNGRTVYRVEFDNKFSKLKYIEPIRIGERIRDIKFLPNSNSIVLALEETGSLLFFKTKN